MGNQAINCQSFDINVVLWGWYIETKNAYMAQTSSYQAITELQCDCRESREFQTFKTVGNWHDICSQFQTVKTTVGSCRP